MKVVEDSPQNARNCTIFKNFLGGACPQTPLTKARSFAACRPISKISEILKLAPPPEKSCIRPCPPTPPPSLQKTTKDRHLGYISTLIKVISYFQDFYSSYIFRNICQKINKKADKYT